MEIYELQIPLEWLFLMIAICLESSFGSSEHTSDGTVEDDPTALVSILQWLNGASFKLLLLHFCHALCLLGIKQMQ